MGDSAASYGLASSPEQPAGWHTPVDRVRHGDESDLAAWDEIALDLGV